MQHAITINKITPVTHDVRQIRCSRPSGYDFFPGQATEVAINKPEWKEKKRPFTFTSLDDADHLEFTIKIYSDHDGVTSQIGNLKEGDQLLVDDVWGTIAYQGPGYFIAGGAGITPFIAILRDLHRKGEMKDNRLFFANKTSKDIILEDELKSMLGSNVTFLLDQNDGVHHHGFIDENFLKKNIQDVSRPFYVCGPPGMVETINKTLISMGATVEKVVFEK